MLLTQARISLGCSSKISCAVLVPEEFVISLRIPSKHGKIGPLSARKRNAVQILAGHIICRGRPLNSFAVSRAANSIDPDQTEPTLFAKKYFLNIPAEDKTDKFYCD